MLQEMVNDLLDAGTDVKPGRRLPDGNRVGKQYADALDILQASDAKMRRAFHAYERALKETRRLEKILNKLQELQS